MLSSILRNGTTPPLGYKIVEAERRGQKIKKKLDIDPVEAETAKLMVRLYLEGDEATGPLGVKETTVWLNRHGSVLGVRSFKSKWRAMADEDGHYSFAVAL